MRRYAVNDDSIGCYNETSNEREWKIQMTQTVPAIGRCGCVTFAPQDLTHCDHTRQKVVFFVVRVRLSLSPSIPQPGKGPPQPVTQHPSTRRKGKYGGNRRACGNGGRPQPFALRRLLRGDSRRADLAVRCRRFDEGLFWCIVRGKFSFMFRLPGHREIGCDIIGVVSDTGRIARGVIALGTD